MRHTSGAGSSPRLRVPPSIPPFSDDSLGATFSSSARAEHGSRIRIVIYRSMPRPLPESDIQERHSERRKTAGEPERAPADPGRACPAFIWKVPECERDPFSACAHVIGRNRVAGRSYTGGTFSILHTQGRAGARESRRMTLQHITWRASARRRALRHFSRKPQVATFPDDPRKRDLRERGIGPADPLTLRVVPPARTQRSKTSSMSMGGGSWASRPGGASCAGGPISGSSSSHCSSSGSSSSSVR